MRLAALEPAGGRLRGVELAPGLLLWLLLAVATGWNRVEPLLDNDGYMHVVRLWDIVARGSWGGGWFSRDGAPVGMVLHWTMPYDLVELALAAPLAPWLGWHEAIRLTAPGGALATGLMLVAASAWAIAPAGRPIATTLAGLLAATPPVVLAYGSLGRDDHHLLILAAWVAVGGALWRLLRPGAGWRAGALLGLLAGVGAWIATESAPPALGAALAVAALVAIDAPRFRASALGFALALPTTMALALLLDPPLEALSLDRLSPLFLAAGLIAAAAVAIAATTPRWTPLAMVVATAAIVLLAHQFGTTAIFSDPDVGRRFWAGIAEFLPPDNPQALLLALGAGLVGLGLALAAWATSRNPVWALLVAALALLLAIGLRHARFGLYPSAFGALLSAAALARLRPLPLRAGATALAAVAPLVLAALAPGAPQAANGPPRCAVAEAAAAIEQDRPGAIVLADVNLSARLLYAGPTLRTVAGPYHGNADGLVDLAHAAAAIDEAALGAILRRRQADFLLLCPEAGADDGPLRRRLLAGEAPSWLKRVALTDPAAADLKLYRVR